MTQRIQEINKKIIKVMLSFFVIYSVLQSTAISFRLSNNLILIVLMLSLSLQVFLNIRKEKLIFSFRDPEKSVLKYIKPIDGVILLFLLASTIWILIIPPLKGFDVAQAIREAGMLALFILYFPLAILIRIGEIKIGVYKKIFYWSIFTLALLHIIFWFGERSQPGWFQQCLDTLGSTIFFRTDQIITGWGIVRITTSNSILLGIGILMVFSKIGSLRFIDVLCIIIFMSGILCTFLRSIWLGVFCGAFILIIYFFYALRCKEKGKCRDIMIILGMFFLCCISLDSLLFEGAVLNRGSSLFSYSSESQMSIAESSNYASDQTLSEGNDILDPESEFPEEESPEGQGAISIFDAQKDKEGALYSNDIKIEQSKALLDGWKKSPIIGYGYGSYLEEYRRSESNPYAYEMTLFSLLLKTGILGISFWAILFIFMIKKAVEYLNKKSLAIWLAVLVCFFISIQTNPLLFSINSLSFIMYLILYLVGNEKNKEMEKKL